MPQGVDPVPRPFWRHLPRFFGFPLQLQPLGYAALLALSSLIFSLSPNSLVLFVVEFGILLAATRYGFKIMVLGARGIFRAGDFPRGLDDEWVYLPWKMFALVLVQGAAGALLVASSPELGAIAVLVLSLAWPATIMVLVQTGSFLKTLNPVEIWRAIRAVGWAYILLVAFLLLLNFGSQSAMTALLPLVNKWLLLPAINFVLNYFGWVMASMLGYVMYQNHASSGTELLPGAHDDEHEAGARTPAQIAQSHVDELVAQMVAEGDIQGAVMLAYEEQRAQADDLAAHRRYHRILLLAPDKKSTLLDHGRRLIGLMVQRDQASEALQIYRSCREKDAAFVLDDPLATLALSRAEWRNGDAKAALGLLSGFDKRFRGHAAIPQVYELAVRVLVQGLDRRDMAKPILAALEARYPDSEQTREARWLLREVAAP